MVETKQDSSIEVRANIYELSVDLWLVSTRSNKKAKDQLFFNRASQSSAQCKHSVKERITHHDEAKGAH